VREFRERISSFLESDVPVAVTRRGKPSVSMFQQAESALIRGSSELKAAADRLAEALAGVDEERGRVRVQTVAPKRKGRGSLR